MNAIRPARVAGLFYPDNPARLLTDVRRMLARGASVALPGRVIGLMVPHAGHEYSGSIAAAAYALPAVAQCGTAIIVSPSHREAFHGVSIFAGTAYETPLGTLPVDRELQEAFREYGAPLFLSERGHQDEHAIEVQLPFLQCVNPDCRIVPVVMGDQKPETCLRLGDALARILERHAARNVLLIASSDLSHFHHQSTALELDTLAGHAVASLDPRELLENLDCGKTEACGGGPIAAVMHAAVQLGANRGVVLDRCTSGDVTGEMRRVVGYMSAAFVRADAATETAA